MGLGCCYVCGTALDGYDLGQCPHCDRWCWLGVENCGICNIMDRNYWGRGPRRP